MSYGLARGEQTVSVVPAKTGDPGGTEAEYYTWATEAVNHVNITNVTGSGITMKILFFDTAADTAVSATKYDHILAAGDSVIWNHATESVGIWFSGSAVLGTNYQVVGWV